jgi:hypothetical protein
LLIGALVFGAIYYYQSEQQERGNEAFRNQMKLQEAEANRREAALAREKEEAKILVEQRRSKQQADRALAQQYLKCFGRPIPVDPASMSDQEKLDLYVKMNPSLLAANAGVPSCGE